MRVNPFPLVKPLPIIPYGHAPKAFCLATNVVLAAGHPFPGPFKFCKVINAAVIRVLWLWFELSVWNETFTEGLVTAERS